MKPRNHFEAVQAGVFDAVDGAIRNATSSPTADIMWAIQEGVRLALDPCVSRELLREAVAEGVRLAMLEIGGKP